jgi:hypothetical protein
VSQSVRPTRVSHSATAPADAASYRGVVTRRVRLLSVATACLVLLGVAAVATRAPDTPIDDDVEQAVGKDTRGISAEGDGPDSPASKDDSSTTTAPRRGSSARTAESPSGAVAGGDAVTTTTISGKGGGATTTTPRGGSTTTTTGGPSGPKCPNPKTCDTYKLVDENSGGPRGGTKGWRPASDGTIRIRFYVNPTPPQNSGLSEDTIETAFLAATRIIEAANPRVKYVYEGRTSRIPQSFDGYNDFAFGADAILQHDGAGHIREADIRSPQFATAGEWAYTPCEQRDGSCGNSGSGKLEIMTLIIHETTHTVGLADLFAEETSELTMNPVSGGPGVRKKATLGLGDVLGIRALYPTSAPLPPIYGP